MHVWGAATELWYLWIFNQQLVWAHSFPPVKMDILLLRFYARFLSKLIKWNSQRAKISIHPLYSILSPPTGSMTWPMNELHVSNKNWRQFFPCYNIHVYSISIILLLFLSRMCLLLLVFLAGHGSKFYGQAFWGSTLQISKIMNNFCNLFLKQPR